MTHTRQGASKAPTLTWVVLAGVANGAGAGEGAGEGADGPGAGDGAGAGEGTDGVGVGEGADGAGAGEGAAHSSPCLVPQARTLVCAHSGAAEWPHLGGPAK